MRSKDNSPVPGVQMPVTLRKYVGGLAGLAGQSLTNAPGECLFWPCSRSALYGWDWLGGMRPFALLALQRCWFDWPVSVLV